MRTIALAALAWFCLLVPVCACRCFGDEPAPNESQYKPMPWHLLDLWWDLPNTSEFSSYSIDVNISDDVPSDVNLYVAPIGIGHLNEIAFYGGVQTHSDGITKSDRTSHELGRGAIFSMWGERSLDAIRPSDGGFCQSSGSEGDFVSVRRPYEWKKGSYTYRIVRMDSETINGSPYTWVGAFVYSHERDENIFVGALRFKGDKLTLGKSLASFIEIYGRRRPVADIPKLTVTFGNLRINGEPVPHLAAKAVYPKGVPDYAEAKGQDGKVTVKVGELVADRKERNVELLKE